MQPAGVHGTRPGRPCDEQTGVDRSQAVDVLGRIDQSGHGVAVDLWRYGQLQQDSVYRVVLVQAQQELSELFLVGVRGQVAVKRSHPYRARVLTLAADIDLRSRIVADEHGREPRLWAARSNDLLHALPHARANLRGHGVPVDHGGRHSASLKRGVVDHQLALRAITGEAHHDHAARFRPDHHSVAEGGVDHIVSERERCTTGMRLP